MCMFDVRTSRKKAGRNLFNGPVVNGTPRAIIANSNRTAIVFSYEAGSDPAVDQGLVTIKTADAGGFQIWQLNQTGPSVIMRLEDWGQLVTGGFSLSVTVAGTQVVSVTEVTYLEELDKL